MGRANVLYFVGGNHLYGDNRSLLELILRLKSLLNIHVVIKDESSNSNINGSLSHILSENGIKYSFVSSVLSPPRLKLGQAISLRYLKNWMGFLIRSIKSTILIFSIIKSFKPTIIHSNNGQMYGGFIFSKIFNISHVWHLREYIDKDHGLRHFPSKKVMIYCVNRGYAIANALGVFNYFELESKRAKVIFNPVGLKCGYDEDKEKYILFVGRIIATKGLMDLLEVFALFLKKNSDYKLLLAGGFNKQDLFFQELQERIQYLGIYDSVIFLGYCSQVDSLMKKARCLVVPSFNEAFGRITIEAMFSGCLVVGRNSGGTKEIMELCQNGFLFNNETEFLSCLEIIVNMDNQEYKGMIKRAQSKGATIFSSESIGLEVFSFYEHIMSLSKIA